MRRIGTPLLLVCLLGTGSTAAEDLGVVGKTYEIAEPDLLTVIHSQLEAMAADGRLAEELERLQTRARASAGRPPGRGLPRARESRVYYHDPSWTTEANVIDDRGKHIHPAGTTVNPLDYVSLTTPLVFFDGDDRAQAEWARALIQPTPDSYIPLLTDGPVIELMQAWNTRLYFDQHGRYSAKLGIAALPAVVRQEGDRLRIDEIALVTP